MSMTHTYTKDQGQRSLDSKDRVETNGRTVGTDCIIFLDDTVGKYKYTKSLHLLRDILPTFAGFCA